jgi:hypothetical protein
MDTQNNKDDNIKKYIESLNSIELKAYAIAKAHLQSSFSIEKSIGFIQWSSKQG